MEPMRITGKAGTEKLLRQRGSWVILALLISAFGPYIPNAHGLRVEHIVIYGLAIAFLLSWTRVPGNSRFSHIHTIAVLMILATLSTVLTTVLAGGTINGEVVAGIENYLQPVALLIILISILNHRHYAAPKRLLYLAALTICAMLTLNTVVSLATIFVDTWPMVQYFVGDINNYKGWSVWGNAAALGRYSGIFNQPFECGLAHSIGLLSWIYVIMFARRSKVIHGFLFFGVVIGGLLSVSKVFFLGVPLAVLYWFWMGGRGIKVFWGIIGAVLSIIIFFMWVAPHWSGLERLSNYFVAEEIEYHGGYISYFTAGRLVKETSGPFGLFAMTWQEAPVLGFGFGKWNGPVDNAYIEFFYQGGLVALFLYLAILWSIASRMFMGLKEGITESKLTAILLIIILVAGIGSPVLTINRASILLWVLLILSMGVCSKNRDGGNVEGYSVFCE